VSKLRVLLPSSALLLASMLGCKGAEVDDPADGSGPGPSLDLPSTSGGGGNTSSVSGGGAVTSAGGQRTTPMAVGQSGGATTTPTPSAGLPCDVLNITKKSCGTCHGATPSFGATFSLTTPADFGLHGDHILERIANDQKPMPPPPNARLTAAEQAILKSYVDAGAPAASCANAATDPETMPTTPTTNTDPDVSCYKIVSRASKANDKYDVPQTPDLYHCFDWAPPWGNKDVQIVSAKPITDNARVLHHWILYNTETALTDGNSSDCIGAHPGAAMISGWAPGGQGLEMPADVGLGVMKGGFILETHYNNQVGPGQLDASGVEVCVTEKPRKHVAGIHWLGTQSLNKTVASGTCVPTATEDVTIISSTPHMHLQGRHMKTVINRTAGGTDTLVDQPFDFNTQIGYSTPAVVHKGDTLTTTCTYAKPTQFGEGTNDEMCYNFVLAYPAGGLAQAFQFLRKNDCSGF
jgi:mono/diheme cytochrome c family protein